MHRPKHDQCYSVNLMDSVIREEHGSSHQHYGENCHYNVEWYSEFICVHVSPQLMTLFYTSLFKPLSHIFGKVASAGIMNRKPCTDFCIRGKLCDCGKALSEPAAATVYAPGSAFCHLFCKVTRGVSLTGVTKLCCNAPLCLLCVSSVLFVISKVLPQTSSHSRRLRV